ncbi:MAG: hypothetical protein JWO42_1409 [Chloroflexi bacterium]|nr:hypothetical protein [Chloroflexota bacterium]
MHPLGPTLMGQRVWTQQGRVRRYAIYQLAFDPELR